MPDPLKCQKPLTQWHIIASYKAVNHKKSNSSYNSHLRGCPWKLELRVLTELMHSVNYSAVKKDLYNIQRTLAQQNIYKNLDRHSVYIRGAAGK